MVQDVEVHVAEERRGFDDPFRQLHHVGHQARILRQTACCRAAAEPDHQCPPGIVMEHGRQDPDPPVDEAHGG